MKGKFKFLGISLGIIAVGGLMVGYGLFMGNRESDKFKSIPRIESQEMLETALEQESSLYCLLNMDVKAEPAEDPLGILEGEYAYIMYMKEICELQKDSSYKWTSSENGVSYAVSPALKLFDTYEVELPEGLTEYNYYIENYAELNETTVKAEYLENIDESFYPEKKGTLSGNVRYNVYLAPAETECALYAYVGEGKITLTKGESGQNYIVPNGDITNLYNCHASSRGMLPTLIGMMIVLPLGLMCMVANLVSLIFAALLGNKKGKIKKK